MDHRRVGGGSFSPGLMNGPGIGSLVFTPAAVRSRADCSAEVISSPAATGPSPFLRFSAMRRPSGKLPSYGVINSRYPPELNRQLSFECHLNVARFRSSKSPALSRHAWPLPDLARQ